MAWIMRPQSCGSAPDHSGESNVEYEVEAKHTRADEEARAR
jgi:hypothetical protein